MNGQGRNGSIFLRDAAGAPLGVLGFPNSGGAYEFFTPIGGTFNVRIETLPPIYVEPDTTFVVTAGIDITDLDFALILKTRVAGSIALDGPDAAGTLRTWDSRRRQAGLADLRRRRRHLRLLPGTGTFPARIWPPPAMCRARSRSTSADRDTSLGALA